MADRLRPRDQAEIEKRRLALRYKTVSELGGRLIGQGCKWGALAYIALQARLAVGSLAGQATIADLVFSLGTNVSISIAVSWTVTGGALAIVMRERGLRRRDIKRLAERVQKYEQQLDPKRSSSLLTAVGTTRPEDEL